MFRSVLFKQLDLPGINLSLRLRRIRSLEMSAKGKIDSYFSPKPRTGDVKRQRTSNGDDDADRVKRTKESSETGDQTSVNKTPNADKSPSPQSQYNDGKVSTPLSPEQKQSIEEKRLIALEKLQGKSDLSFMGESWKAALAPEFKKDYYLKLKKFVESQRKLKTIYPSEKDVFSWTQLCSVQEVKVVIIGQDPYHGPNQAHGLCFSVPIGVSAPPSLQNIYKELKNDIEGFEIPSHGYLVGWAKQGVLLLNAVLTVEARNANSHQGKGWEHFTDAVIKWINHNSDKVVFLLWGAYAQKKGASIDKKRHCVLKGPHPSPLSAHRGFFGCKHFSQANSYLESNGKPTIDWKDLPKQL